MKSVFCFILTLVVVMIFVTGSLFANDRIETFEFEGIHSIDVKTVCGGLEIVPGEKSQFIVVVENRLDDPKKFKRNVEARNGRLHIDEDFLGRNVHGGTQWIIYVPEIAGLESVKFSTASGSFMLEDVDVDHVETDIASGHVSINSVQAQEFDLSTASGRIEIEDCKVDKLDAQSASGGVEAREVEAENMELSTASGTVLIRRCNADHIKASSASGRVDVFSVEVREMDLSNTSGRIVAEDCEVYEWAKMSCASGDIRVHLLRLPSESLNAWTASGNVLLEVSEFGDKFTMALIKRADRGKIKCPFEYTDKETIRIHRGDRYLADRYVVRRGAGGPEVELSTASGNIRVDTETKAGR